MVERAHQVSESSVETLFRRGGERFHHFAANLFRKLRTNFIRIVQVLSRYYIKHFGHFLSGHTAYNIHRLTALRSSAKSRIVH